MRKIIFKILIVLNLLFFPFVALVSEVTYGFGDKEVIWL
jgi:hypothetical protein